MTGRATPWGAVSTVLIGAFMAILDSFIVIVAGPSIQADLGAAAGQLQWILAGYQLTYAALLITGGRLGDLYGRRRIFLAGMGVFTAASAVCALAPTASSLIGARFIQGLGAALTLPQVYAFLTVLVHERDRHRAFAALGVAIGLATAILLVTGAPYTPAVTIPTLMLQSVGGGLLITPSLNAVLSRIDPHDAGVASGVLATAQQVGGALGVAVIGVVYFATFDPAAPDGAGAAAHGLAMASFATLAAAVIAVVLVFLLRTAAGDRDLSAPRSLGVPDRQTRPSRTSHRRGPAA
jgi:MFS family permease